MSDLRISEEKKKAEEKKQNEEELSKQNEMDAALGMWIATYVLLPIGFYLTYQASTDSKLLDMETYTKAIRSILDFFKRKSKEQTPAIK